MCKLFCGKLRGIFRCCLLYQLHGMRCRHISTRHRFVECVPQLWSRQGICQCRRGELICLPQLHRRHVWTEHRLGELHRLSIGHIFDEHGGRRFIGLSGLRRWFLSNGHWCVRLHKLPCGHLLDGYRGDKFLELHGLQCRGLRGNIWADKLRELLGW